jgi:hypothetical protein
MIGERRRHAVAEDACLARRAETIRRRLSWDASILSLRGGKPKGMHWRTYERLTAKYERVERRLAATALRFGIII